MAIGHDTGELGLLLTSESVRRAEFEDRVETLRQQYVGRVQAISESGRQADGQASSAISTSTNSCTAAVFHSPSTASSLSSFSSQSSLRALESQTSFPFSPPSS